MSIGQIDVLNTAKGHLELKFETPQEAKTKIESMLREGYTIFVEAEGTTHKVSGFDEGTQEYIVLETQTAEKRYPLAATKATAVAPTRGG